MQGSVVYTSERNCSTGIWSGLQGKGVSSFPATSPLYTYSALVRRCTKHVCIRLVHVTGRTVVNGFSEYFFVFIIGKVNIVNNNNTNIIPQTSVMYFHGQGIFIMYPVLLSEITDGTRICGGLLF